MTASSSPGSESIVEALKTMSSETSKSYLESQYAPTQRTDVLPRVDGKRAFLAKKRAMQNLVQPKEPAPEPEPEPEPEPVWLIPPPIPPIPIARPELRPPVLLERSGLSRLEATSGNISRGLDEFEDLTSEIAAKVAQIESNCLECKELADLGGLLGEASVQQLDDIHGIRQETDFFFEIIEFIRSFLGIEPRRVGRPALRV
jgi:hypothetical protein